MKTHSIQETTVIKGELGLKDQDYQAVKDEDGFITKLTIYDLTTAHFPGDPKELTAILGKLDRLTELFIYSRELTIPDVEAFSQLSALEILHIDAETDIEDLRPLVQLQQLKTLFISKSKISDLSCLSEIKQLKTLFLNFSRIENVSALAELPDLETLDLSVNAIKDITPLVKCKKLVSLVLCNNRVKDLSSLALLPQLRCLQLASNYITTLTALKDLINLEILDLSYNNIEDISVVNRLTKIKELNLSDNPIKDLGPIAALEELTLLGLASIPVSSEFIRKFHKLKSLSVAGCSISDLSFTADLRALKYLNLNDNYIKDVLPLLKLIHLEFLKLRSNPIQDPFPLILCAGLDEVDLRDTPLLDLAVSKYNKGNLPEKQINFSEFIALAVDYYCEQKKYNEALAFGYGNSFDKKMVDIYFALIKETDPLDFYLLNYYIKQCAVSINSNTIYNLPYDQEQEVAAALIKFIKKSKIPGRYSLIRKVRHGLRPFDFGKEMLLNYSQYLKRNPAAKANPDLLYDIGLKLKNYKNYIEAIYVYKKLILLKDPRQYTLYVEIRRRLTLDHKEPVGGELDILLENAATMEIPDFDIAKYCYDYARPNHWKTSYAMSYIKRINWLVVGVFVVTLFILLKLFTG